MERTFGCGNPFSINARHERRPGQAQLVPRASRTLAGELRCLSRWIGKAASKYSACSSILDLATHLRPEFAQIAASCGGHVLAWGGQ